MSARNNTDADRLTALHRMVDESNYDHEKHAAMIAAYKLMRKGVGNNTKSQPDFDIEQLKGEIKFAQDALIIQSKSHVKEIEEMQKRMDAHIAEKIANYKLGFSRQKAHEFAVQHNRRARINYNTIRRVVVCLLMVAIVVLWQSAPRYY